MTEETSTLKVEQWPFDAIEARPDRVRFAPQVVTIGYVNVNERGPSYKFREDTTVEQREGKEYRGRFWRLRGEFDEANRTFDVATDPGFKENDRVRVLLQLDKGQYGVVTRIQQAPAATQSAPTTVAGGQTPTRDETRASISLKAGRP